MANIWNKFIGLVVSLVMNPMHGSVVYSVDFKLIYEENQIATARFHRRNATQKKNLIK